MCLCLSERPLTQAARITGIFASRTRPVEVDLADATDVVLRNVPSPGSDRVPLLDGDFHGDSPLGGVTGLIREGLERVESVKMTMEP